MKKGQVYAWDHNHAILGPPIVDGYPLGDLLLVGVLALVAGILIAACIARLARK